MVSRILHLLVVDILAVGVAMRRHVEEQPLPEAGNGEGLAREAELEAAPAQGQGSTLARLTSHSR